MVCKVKGSHICDVFLDGIKLRIHPRALANGFDATIIIIDIHLSQTTFKQRCIVSSRDALLRRSVEIKHHVAKICSKERHLLPSLNLDIKEC
jgi:hypothetical protein